MSGFTKLFGTLITSTIWREDDKTRVVWITMLALADRNGEVGASVPGLAAMANVETEQCRAALAVLASPDLDSRTQEHEGRRIEAIDGGWKLLNYAKYRELGRSVDRTEYLRVKQQESRARRSVSTSVNQDQPISEVRSRAISESERFAQRTPDLTRGVDKKLAADKNIRHATPEELAALRVKKNG
jgi:hypothetical protein